MSYRFTEEVRAELGWTRSRTNVWWVGGPLRDTDNSWFPRRVGGQYGRRRTVRSDRPGTRIRVLGSYGSCLEDGRTVTRVSWDVWVGTRLQVSVSVVVPGRPSGRRGGGILRFPRVVSCRPVRYGRDGARTRGVAGRDKTTPG